MKGELQGDRVVVSDNPSISNLYGKRSYGSIQDKKLYLNMIEAYYLCEKEKLEVYLDDRVLSAIEMVSMTNVEKDFREKYSVYKDLRDRGYIVKTGFKYGCHFRVYRNTVEEHAEYLVHSYVEHGSMEVDEIIKQARLAHSVKKKLVIALVDQENDITYLSLNWVKI
ncbi:MAG: tRNA-intron lyase [Candidatus Methanofastidiosa archaeon]|nr:tRNA-intron lyase [Candidatus Methanofastidiosa archaeon]